MTLPRRPRPKKKKKGSRIEFQAKHFHTGLVKKPSKLGTNKLGKCVKTDGGTTCSGEGCVDVCRAERVCVCARGRKRAARAADDHPLQSDNKGRRAHRLLFDLGRLEGNAIVWWTLGAPHTHAHTHRSHCGVIFFFLHTQVSVSELQQRIRVRITSPAPWLCKPRRVNYSHAQRAKMSDVQDYTLPPCPSIARASLRPRDRWTAAIVFWKLSKQQKNKKCSNGAKA